MLILHRHRNDPELRRSGMSPGRINTACHRTLQSNVTATRVAIHLPPRARPPLDLP